MKTQSEIMTLQDKLDCPLSYCDDNRGLLCEFDDCKCYGCLHGLQVAYGDDCFKLLEDDVNEGVKKRINMVRNGLL